jgi:hypothetical protein
MTYKKAFEILEKHLVPLWKKYPVSHVLLYMTRHGSKTSPKDFERAYQFMTESKKREAVFKVWFLMNLVPSDKQNC